MVNRWCFKAIMESKHGRYSKLTVLHFINSLGDATSLPRWQSSPSGSTIGISLRIEVWRLKMVVNVAILP